MASILNGSHPALSPGDDHNQPAASRRGLRLCSTSHIAACPRRIYLADPISAQVALTRGQAIRTPPRPVRMFQLCCSVVVGDQLFRFSVHERGLLACCLLLWVSRP